MSRRPSVIERGFTPFPPLSPAPATSASASASASGLPPPPSTSASALADLEDRIRHLMHSDASPPSPRRARRSVETYRNNVGVYTRDFDPRRKKQLQAALRATLPTEGMDRGTTAAATAAAAAHGPHVPPTPVAAMPSPSMRSPRHYSRSYTTTPRASYTQQQQRTPSPPRAAAAATHTPRTPLSMWTETYHASYNRRLGRMMRSGSNTSTISGGGGSMTARGSMGDPLRFHTPMPPSGSIASARSAHTSPTQSQRRISTASNRRATLSTLPRTRTAAAPVDALVPLHREEEEPQRAEYVLHSPSKGSSYIPNPFLDLVDAGTPATPSHALISFASHPPSAARLSPSFSFHPSPGPPPALMSGSPSGRSHGGSSSSLSPPRPRPVSSLAAFDRYLRRFTAQHPQSAKFELEAEPVETRTAEGEQQQQQHGMDEDKNGSGGRRASQSHARRTTPILTISEGGTVSDWPPPSLAIVRASHASAEHPSAGPTQYSDVLNTRVGVPHPALAARAMDRRRRVRRSTKRQTAPSRNSGGTTFFASIASALAVPATPSSAHAAVASATGSGGGWPRASS